jgi:hypothetical protein
MSREAKRLVPQGLPCFKQGLYICIPILIHHEISFSSYSQDSFSHHQA